MRNQFIAHHIESFADVSFLVPEAMRHKSLENLQRIALSDKSESSFLVFRVHRISCFVFLSIRMVAGAWFGQGSLV